MHAPVNFSALAAAGRRQRLDAEFFLDAEVLIDGAQLSVERRVTGPAQFRITYPRRETLVGTAHQLTIIDTESARFWWGWAGASLAHHGAHPGTGVEELAYLPCSPVDTTAATWLYDYGRHHDLTEFTRPELPFEHDVAVSIAAACQALGEFVYLEVPINHDFRFAIGWLLDRASLQSATAERTSPEPRIVHPSTKQPPAPIAPPPTAPAPPPTAHLTFEQIIDDAALLSAEFQLLTDAFIDGITAAHRDDEHQLITFVHPRRGTVSCDMHVLGVEDLTRSIWQWNWDLERPYGSPAVSRLVRAFGQSQHIEPLTARTVPLTSPVSLRTLLTATKPITGMWAIISQPIAADRVLHMAISSPALRTEPPTIDTLDAVLVHALGSQQPVMTDQRRALVTWALLHDGIVGHRHDATRQRYHLHLADAEPVTVWFDGDGHLLRVTTASETAAIDAGTLAAPTPRPVAEPTVA